MKLRIFFIIVALTSMCVYIYQFHQDKYNSAVSLVVEGTKALKKKVGLNAATDIPSVVTPDSGKQVINSLIDEILAATSEPVNPPDGSTDVTTFHSNQIAYAKRRKEMCPAVLKVPWSQYGTYIKPMGLSYFTKYDDNNYFLYCAIPKVASTNWKRTLIVLSYDEESRSHLTREDVNALRNVHNNPAVKSLSRVGGSPLSRPYKGYYKFTVFRHPFTRMVSAWRNKLQLTNGNVNKYFYKNYGIKMLTLSRGNSAEKAFYRNQAANLVTFPEFVNGVKHGIVDRHWMPQAEICQPCVVQYDFVGFFEHLSNDTNYILDQVGVHDEAVRADKRSQASQLISTTQMTVELFNALPPADVDAMYQFYKRDFLLFGYDRDVNSPTFPFPAVPLTECATDACAAQGSS